LQRYNYLHVLTNIQKIIGGKISIGVSLFQISNPKSKVSNYRNTDFTTCGYEIFFVYFVRFVESYYPEQLRHVIAHVCLMSHRPTGNIRSFIPEHVVINNQNCTGKLFLGLNFLLMYFFNRQYALSRRQT